MAVNKNSSNYFKIVIVTQFKIHININGSIYVEMNA